jgi:hypothetical protein
MILRQRFLRPARCIIAGRPYLRELNGNIARGH